MRLGRKLNWLYTFGGVARRKQSQRMLKSNCNLSLNSNLFSAYTLLDTLFYIPYTPDIFLPIKINYIIQKFKLYTVYNKAIVHNEIPWFDIFRGKCNNQVFKTFQITRFFLRRKAAYPKSIKICLCFCNVFNFLRPLKNEVAVKTYAWRHWVKVRRIWMTIFLRKIICFVISCTYILKEIHKLASCVYSVIVHLGSVERYSKSDQIRIHTVSNVMQRYIWSLNMKYDAVLCNSLCSILN